MAILPYIEMYTLQVQNIKRNTIKKAHINECNPPIIQDNELCDEHITNENINNTENIEPIVDTSTSIVDTSIVDTSIK